MTPRQKYIIFAVLAVIIGYVVFSWMQQPSIRNRGSSGTSIVAFGDSLVRGVGSTPGNDFISLLSAGIGEPIINLGVSGNTTVDGLVRTQSVIDENPRLVIILLGGNDFLRHIPIGTTFSNLATIVTTFQENGAAVLLLGVRGGLLTDTYEDRFEDFAREYQTGYVPNVLAGLLGDSRYMSDAIHPNDVGYAKIANKVEPTLKKLLE